MPEEVLFCYFGQQCPWTDYFASQASRAAELLHLPYRSVDIGQQPELGERYHLFFPGTVVIGDFQLVYPGRAEQMVESYHLRGPLPGKSDHQEKPPGKVERVSEMTGDDCVGAMRCCSPGVEASCLTQKASWLSSMLGNKSAGLIGWSGEQVVGFAEILPETMIPYSIGEKTVERAFITCLYSPIEWGLERDYRASLVQHLLSYAKRQGYLAVSAVSGVRTPAPNGPLAVFEQLGFERVQQLGRALQKHNWEDAWLMRKQLSETDLVTDITVQ